MLFRITRDCDMGCTHCLIDAEVNGLHMDEKTVTQAIKFMRFNNPAVIMITGGEPFGHPRIFEIIEELVATGFPKGLIAISSNGVPLQDPEFCAGAIATGTSIQVVNDPKYYPRRVILPTKEIEVIDWVGAPIAPVGRAKKNGLECTSKMPSCFNLRSLSRHTSTLKGLLKELEIRRRFCTPCIDYDGTVKLGEHIHCPAIGTVWDDSDFIFKKIVQHKCNACSMFDGMDPAYKRAVGED